MKKIFNVWTLLLAAILASCSQEAEHVFDKSAAQRATESMTAAQQVLEAAPNGWRMEYYGDMTLGGYNVFCKFSDGKVTVASQKVGVSHNAGLDEDGNPITCTTHYKIEQSQGVVLSFDEYNTVFHYLSEPNNPDYGTAEDGFYGDFEFRILSAQPDKVVLEGKKHENKIVMYPMPEDQSWAEYIAQADETETYMLSRTYTLTGEGVDRQIVANIPYNHRMVFYYIDDSEQTQQITAPYIVRPDGYFFYEPIEVNGLRIEGMLKGDTEDYFLVSNNDKLRLETYVPPIGESLQTGMWFIAYSKLGEYGKAKWDIFREALKTAGPNKTELKVLNALIGTYGGKQALHILAGADYLYEGFTISIDNEEGDEVTLKWDSKVRNSTAKTFYRKYKSANAMNPFYGGGQGRSFKLTYDNLRHPSYITLTDKNEPTNVITLVRDQVNYPFDN